MFGNKKEANKTKKEILVAKEIRLREKLLNDYNGQA